MTVLVLCALWTSAVAYNRFEQGSCYWQLGWLMMNSGRPDEAEEPFRHALNLYAKLVADYPNGTEYQARMSRSYEELIGDLLAKGKQAQAEKILRQALADAERRVAEFPTLFLLRPAHEENSSFNIPWTEWVAGRFAVQPVDKMTSWTRKSESKQPSVKTRTK